MKTKNTSEAEYQKQVHIWNYGNPTRPPEQDIDWHAAAVQVSKELVQIRTQRDELLAALTETALNRQDKIDWVKINKLIAKCEAQP